MRNTVFNPEGKLTIEDVYVWMDGGSVTLIIKDSGSKSSEIEFVQKEFLVKHDNLNYPGSLLLDKKEVEIRSELESKILSYIENADWGSNIVENEKTRLKSLILECIEYILSDKYIEIARQVGRL